MDFPPPTAAKIPWCETLSINQTNQLGLVIVSSEQDSYYLRIGIDDYPNQLFHNSNKEFPLSMSSVFSISAKADKVKQNFSYLSSSTLGMNVVLPNRKRLDHESTLWLFANLQFDPPALRQEMATFTSFASLRSEDGTLEQGLSATTGKINFRSKTVFIEDFDPRLGTEWYRGYDGAIIAKSRLSSSASREFFLWADGWKHLTTVKSSTVFRPIAVYADGGLLVLTNLRSDRIRVVKYTEPDFVREVFGNEVFDVLDASIDFDGRILVTLSDIGRSKFVFDEMVGNAIRTPHRQLATSVPSPTGFDISASGFHSSKAQCRHLFGNFSKYNVTISRFNAQLGDSILYDSPANRRLVVDIKGGPATAVYVGSSDYLGDIPDTSVLAVNYPGSSGRGRKFADQVFLDRGKSAAHAVDVAVQNTLAGTQSRFEAVELVGESFGGFIALRLLATGKTRYRSATLINPALDFRFRSQDDLNQSGKSDTFYAPLINACRLGTSLRFYLGENDEIVDGKTTEHFAHLCQERGADVSVENLPNEGHSLSPTGQAFVNRRLIGKP